MTSSDSAFKDDFIPDGLLTLFISSPDRYSGEVHDAYYTLPRSYTNVKSLELVQFNILNCFFALYNAVFPLLDNSVQFWIQLSNATYISGADFAAQLQLDINNTFGLSQVYTVTFDPLTLEIVISAPNVFVIDWLTAAGTNPVGTNPANYQMGFGYSYPTQDYSSARGLEVISPFPIHPLNWDNIGIVINVSAQDGVTTNNTTFTYAIPNNVPYGMELFYERGTRQDQTLTFDNPQSLTNLHVQLINLVNGAPLHTRASEYGLKLRLTLAPMRQQGSRALMH